MLILTKPLGTGIVAFAAQIDRARPESMQAAAASMTSLNKTAAELMVQFGAHACTDVTGFSLMGHLAEMARSSGVDVQIVWDDLPLFDGVLEYAAAGILPGAIERNKESCADRVVASERLPQEMVDICFDAQTSGGLLIAIEQAKAAASAQGPSRSRHLGSDHHRQDPGHRVGPDPPRNHRPTRNSHARLCQDNRALTIINHQSSIINARRFPAVPMPSHRRRLQAGARQMDQVKTAFKQFLSAANAPHSLDAYTKQAMAIALSVALRCEPCLKMHLKNARKKGFSEAEIDEAAWMGISFAGSPAMVFYEQLKNRK